MHKAWLGGIVVAGLLVGGAAQAQTVQAGGLELDLSGRVQAQFNTTSVDEDVLGETLPSSVFETRRVRFGTKFDYEGWLTGTVEADFGGESARLTDGFIDARLADGFVLRAGQFKKPFGLIELTSSTQTPMIERSARIRGLEDLLALRAGAVIGEEQWLLDESGYVGRQIGVMAHGTVGRLGYAAGVFNGEGANQREVEGSKAFAARVTYAVTEPLVLGVAVGSQPTGSFDADGDEIHVQALSVDAEYGAFRRPGLHVLAEAMYGDNGLILDAVDFEPATMAGAQVIAAWFVPREGGRVEGLEPLLRVSWGDPSGDDSDSGVLLTPGANVYFTGRNRFMVN
nr:hypothetical protein [Gemmatimonadota bacterium]NIU77059.1 hypothetical protein [Gammaproteobacteria bacterium]NIY10710.1 hypothetical protein [Gemmatimonadota bacterium]